MSSLLGLLQALPAVGSPDAVVTLVVVIVALFVAKLLLGMALRIAILVALVAGALWLLSAIGDVWMGLPV